MTTETPTQPDNALAQIIDEGGLSADATKAVIRQAFAPLVASLGNLTRDAESITVTDATQLDAMAEAKRVRLLVRDVRTGAEKIKTALKADALATSRVLDACNRWIAERATPIESRLLEAELFAERAQAKRKADLAAERAPQLRAYGVDPSLYPLGDMKDADWARTLEGARLSFEAEEARAAKARQDAIDQAEAARVERERVNAENARLKAEAQKREAAMAEQRRKAQADADAAAEKARKERLRLQGLADIERQKREAAEKIAREKDAAEKAAKAKADRAAKKAAAAPDADKLRALALAFSRIALPTVATDEGRASMVIVNRAINALIDTIRDEAEQIGGA